MSRIDEMLQEAILNGRDFRSRCTSFEISSDGDARMTYKGSTIAKVSYADTEGQVEHFSIACDKGKTKAARQRLNALLRPHGLGLSLRQGNWFIHDRKGMKQWEGDWMELSPSV